MGVAFAQEPVEPRAQPPGKEEEESSSQEFFSGRVLAVSQEKLTVVRDGSHSEPEERTFLLTASTRVEGKLRVRARVTVGYQSGEAGDVATRVIVRKQ